jgi:hypothetical protein
VCKKGVLFTRTRMGGEGFVKMCVEAVLVTRTRNEGKSVC